MNAETQLQSIADFLGEQKAKLETLFPVKPDLTPEEICESFSAEFPDRTIHANRTLAKYDHMEGVHVDCRISVQPGFDGSECQQFGGDLNTSTFRECIGHLVAWGEQELLSSH